MIATNITDADRERIAAAIKRAEANTTGEIYVVIDREEHGYPVVPLLWGAVLALLVPWPLYLFTYLQPTTIFLIQAVTFVLVSLVASLRPLRHLLVPESLAFSYARKTAETQFMAHGVHLTRERTGVLIYVAPADRRVEIVADEGINSKVQQGTWDELVLDVVRPAGLGQLADGVIAVVERAGALLAQHFPAGPVNANELTDRVVEI